MKNPIRELREKMRLNQADFAKLIEAKAGTLSHWETGLRYPFRRSFLKLLRLAKKFELDNELIAYMEKE